VLLVGGAARLDAVARLAERMLGRPPLRFARPEEAVAAGAATHARRLQQAEFGSCSP
jgi:molecular chaperone DnaK (HSP70)